MDAPSQILRQRCKAAGFTRVRFATLSDPAPGITDYDRFLAEERQADMDWMVAGRGARADPTNLLPGARSAVVLGIDYGWPRPPDPGGLTGKVACYAWGRDYHNLVGKRLRRVVRDLRQAVPGAGFYWSVDSRPVIERAWAAQAGIGFAGKNCLIIVPARSSYLFLAVILTTLELEADTPMGDHCGRCTRCLTGCPTDAFTGPGQLDARRCISYHTIENRGEIPEELRSSFGRWVFGCDDCQEVCPHNGTPTELEADFAPRPGHAWLDLEWVLSTDDDALDAHFLGSPIRRAKPWGLKRNACVVLGNLGDPAARPALHRALGHPHDIVKKHARWALDLL